MEIFSSFIAPLIVAFSSLTSIGAGDVSVVSEPVGVEVGLLEVSPNGSAGGFAVPACGCSTLHRGIIHDCNPSGGSNPGGPSVEVCDDGSTVIRSGESVDICYDNQTIINCEVIDSLGNVLIPSITGLGSETFTPLSDTQLGIICNEQSEYSDTVGIRVLPRIQET